ncbi:response regulator transcription factor [Exiguobacterium flavidum]|uniref:response regulator transcription factor n=1 Tax=Exiguobacterium flavidum TaxID=2184695 RepID=UPI000DF785CE|nr:response regulator transcription factor [Exiguobacterium flavidum]
MKILIAEDDAMIRNLIADTLTAAGHAVTAARTGSEASRLIASETFEAAVLDVMLPGKDGLALCQELRKTQEIPIILLTALGALDDKRAGFDIGADDYMTKPFLPEELLFRLQAVARRYRKAALPVLSLGGVTIDKTSYLVKQADQTIRLPRKEFELLYQLASFPGRVFSRDELIERIWGIDFEGDDRTIDVHVKRLRERFLDAGFEILTVRGLGYRLEVR